MADDRALKIMKQGGETLREIQEQVFHETVIPPLQCPYKRAATWWEIVKFLLLGRLRGFDPDYECRCYHYSGHGEFGYRHQSVDGTEWDS